jgi:hypothetical protein
LLQFSAALLAEAFRARALPAQLLGEASEEAVEALSEDL